MAGCAKHEVSVIVSQELMPGAQGSYKQPLGIAACSVHRAKLCSGSLGCGHTLSRCLERTPPDADTGLRLWWPAL